jgi:hypothetical protein
MTFPSVDLQGNVLSAEVLDLIARGEAEGQKPAAFGLPADTTVDRAIGEAWAAARTYWKAFADKRAKLKEGDTGTTLTRRNWMTLLLGELGYELEQYAQAEVLNEKSYPISHRATNRGGLPVHIVGVGQELDKRATAGPRLSPHALLQEYLNHSEHVYGVVSNGLQLRLLRDSVRLGRLAYVEFDLERILDQEIYPDFAALYRALHATRMPVRPEATEEAHIERYHQKGIDDGTRIKELRKAVKQGMEVLANGLLEANPELAQAAMDKRIDPKAFYKLLMRCVYRMLFLIVIEERDLVHPAPQGPEDEVNAWRDIYRRYYSFARLRRLALHSAYVDGRKTDLWQSLLSTFRLFERDGHGRALGIAPLGGELFGKAMAVNGFDLHTLRLVNSDTLRILEGLTITLNDQGARVPVNYNDLDVEELGSIYEGLLELQAEIYRDTGKPIFGFTPGSQRKLTGSYYTRHDLVAQLIKTALDPVVEERLKGKRTPAEQEAALLGISVVDPACGSGHFLLAAARKLAQRLAEVRSGEENPGRDWVLDARRDVISRCIHGVDKNQDAIDLCRLALWLEAHTSGKPLTFLDHRIRCGDALVGVDDLNLLREGLPDGAFKPVSGDKSAVASEAKARNKAFLRTRQLGLFSGGESLESHVQRYAEGFRAVNALRSDDLDALAEQEKRYTKYKSDRGWWKDKVACDLFVYAFFQPYAEGTAMKDLVTTELLWQQMAGGGSFHAQVEARALQLAEHEHFFHWPLEFPDVWERGGFDVVLGNPPWERVKLEEKEFFGSRSEEVAQAKKASDRKRIIARLKQSDPALYAEYEQALHGAEASSKYIRESGLYPLCGRGDVNLYTVFAEGSRKHLRTGGRMGMVLPTGIATDDTTKFFFQDLIDKGSLVSLYDFENKLLIFPDVAPPQKFCLFTSRGAQPVPAAERRPAEFVFFAHRVEDLLDTDRRFTLGTDDIALLNPNTRTCPIFRSRRDAELTKAIYRQVPVLVREGDPDGNPWGLQFSRMFDMANDSGLFRTLEELEQEGWQLHGNVFVRGQERYLPLYEPKLFHQFNHRYNTYASVPVESRFNVKAFAYSIEHPEDPNQVALPRYWVAEDETLKALEGLVQPYLIGFRNIINVSTNRRTSVFSVLPLVAANHAVQLILTTASSEQNAFLTGALDSFVFDYCLRQKIGGSNLSFFIVKQVPAPVPDLYLHVPSWSSGAPWSEWMTSRITELVYTAWDIRPFAQTLQCTSPPFRWDAERRFQIRAELDAAFFHLYLGTPEDWKAQGTAELLAAFPTPRHAVEHILGTFPIVQRQEEEKYGHYRSKETILRIYDAMGEAARTGTAWQSPLDPPPGDPRCCHPNDPHAATAPPPRPVVSSPAPRAPQATASSSEKRGPGRPPKPTGDASAAAAAILAHLRATPGLHSKSAILAATGLDTGLWNAAIKQLVEEGQVKKEGEKKGARYGV